MAENLRIALAKFQNGSSASIEEEDWGDSIIIFQHPRLNAFAACKRSAKILRALADRFEQLANEQYPYRETTQQSINRGHGVRNGSDQMPEVQSTIVQG